MRHSPTKMSLFVDHTDTEPTLPKLESEIASPLLSLAYSKVPYYSWFCFLPLYRKYQIRVHFNTYTAFKLPYDLLIDPCTLAMTPSLT